MMATEMMRKLGVPACVVEGRLLNEGHFFNQKSGILKERKKTNPSDWAKKEEAARILGVSLEDVLLLVKRNKLNTGIRRGDLYISRESIEECKKKLPIEESVEVLEVVRIRYIPKKKTESEKVVLSVPKEMVKIEEVVRPKYVIIKTRPFEPPKSKFRYINLTEYSSGQFGYEINDAAIALKKDISFIQSLIDRHKVEAVDIGDKRYIPRQSLRDFLKEVEAKKLRT